MRPTLIAIILITVSPIASLVRASASIDRESASINHAGANINHASANINRPALLHLRGGAKTSTRRELAEQRGPSKKFVAYVLAWAFLPAIVRIVLSNYFKTAPALSDVVTPTLWQRLGVSAISYEAQSAMLQAPSASAWKTALGAVPMRWQLALSAAWATNMLAVAIPGRYDGRSAMAADKPTAATANLFTPAGWAFIIWAPIFLGEWLMMLYLTNVPAAAPLGRAMAPGWIAAVSAQVGWCATFRPSVCGPATLWLPAALLAATGAGLSVAHRAVRSSGGAAGLRGCANALVRWPVTLHFGWVVAASLVNGNNWLARSGSALSVREAAAYASVAAAVAVAAYVTATTRDPVFAAVIAWALAAVAADGASGARGLIADGRLDRIRNAARGGCALAVVLVCSQL